MSGTRNRFRAEDLGYYAFLAFIGLIGAAIIAVPVIVLAVKANTPDSGIITSTEFTAAHCGFVGKLYLCDDDQWEFQLTNEQQHKSGWVDVSKSDYERYGIGDQYSIKG